MPKERFKFCLKSRLLRGAHPDPGTARPAPSLAYPAPTWAPFLWPSSAVSRPGSPSPSGAASLEARSAWPGLVRPRGLSGKRERNGPGSEGAQGSPPTRTKPGLDRSAHSGLLPPGPAALLPALEVPAQALLTLGHPQQLQAPPQQSCRHGCT